MSETQTIEVPDFQSFDEIDTMNHDGMHRAVAGLYDQDHAPAFVVRGSEQVPNIARNRDVGAGVLRVVRHLRGHGYQLQAENVVGRYLSSPEHQDGVVVDPFMQVHTNMGPARAEVIINVRELSPAVQQELAATPMDEHRQAFEHPHAYPLEVAEAPADTWRFAPPAVTYAPIVARYRTFLDVGDTIVFRNGFNMLEPSEEPKKVPTHKFHSVDDDGNPIHSSTDPNDGRNIDVSFVAPVVRYKLPQADRPRRGLLGRRKRA